MSLELTHTHKIKLYTYTVHKTKEHKYIIQQQQNSMNSKCKNNKLMFNTKCTVINQIQQRHKTHLLHRNLGRAKKLQKQHVLAENTILQ